MVHLTQTLTLITPGACSPRCEQTLRSALQTIPVCRRQTLSEPLHNARILFVISLDESGINPAFYKLLAYLRTRPNCLKGCVGGVVIDGCGDLYTKSIGRELVLAANLAGCTFPGRPLVEATGDLRNFTVQARNGSCSLQEAYQNAVADLTGRVLRFSHPRSACPKLLVLHASSHRTSNTLALWSRIRAGLEPYCDFREIGLRNGTLEDCAGCPYTMCLHFGEQGDCFYGGVMVQEVYPSIREADAVILLCPNYNDALSANLTAAINRLTALYRTTPFSDKAVFALVVSGYSGGDIVASQVVSALNMNKGFWLPAGFALLETANDAGTAITLPGITARLQSFTENIRHHLM